MSVDGIIILENSGRTSHRLVRLSIHKRRVSPPAHRYTQQRPIVNNVDPVLYVPGYISDGKQSACCHVKCGDVRILAAIRGDGDLLFAFAFIHIFVEILQDYFGTLSAATLSDNFDVVYQAGSSQSDGNQVI
ncbi:hypothetical protein BJ322DRAFT_1157555 [Thelephora terrestris]|uniref:Uncharacterized protein n=1 Tax=Thelephora terrestris TaxID=56493 RepID=A0A9P6HA28_9AGAM|nr:hypothetical protein BJ322DRAFT_1157555 [Thelephora terrestris]